MAQVANTFESTKPLLKESYSSSERFKNLKKKLKTKE